LSNFESGVWNGAVQQQIFRKLVTAMSSPGEIIMLGNETGRTAIAVLATLLDNTTALCDHDRTLDKSTLGFLQARPTSCEQADYILADACNAPGRDFVVCLGELAAPEGGATLILEGARLGSGDLTLEISGPGVFGTRRIELAGFHLHWFERRAEWVSDFPLGVDLIMVDAESLVCVPRSTVLSWT